jgi:hypothetical protein
VNGVSCCNATLCIASSRLPYGTVPTVSMASAGGGGDSDGEAAPLNAMEVCSAILSPAETMVLAIYDLGAALRIQ